jgi:hypothetical protein
VTLVSRPFNAGSGILVDTNYKPTELQARQMWAAGVRGIWRYVFFGPARPGDLDGAELQILLGLGFWVGCVQHVPKESWHADISTGLAHAQSSVSNAIRAGYVTPEGQHPVALALDMEGIGNPGASSLAYARVSLQVRHTQGYQGVVYCGYDSGLKSEDLDSLNDDESCGGSMLEWWCDFAPLTSRPVPARGYAGHQKPQSVLGGVPVDVDQVLRDNAIYGLVLRDIYEDETDAANANIPRPAA